jgi:hypothetical protein
LFFLLFEDLVVFFDSFVVFCFVVFGLVVFCVVAFVVLDGVRADGFYPEYRDLRRLP